MHTSSLQLTQFIQFNQLLSNYTTTIDKLHNNLHLGLYGM